MPRQRQQAAQNTGFNSVTCAVELHEPARVDEPVHDSRRHLVVAEHGHPLAELYVGRDDHALPALRHRHHLEQQPRALDVQRHVAQLVQDEEFAAGATLSGLPPRISRRRKE